MFQNIENTVLQSLHILYSCIGGFHSAQLFKWGVSLKNVSSLRHIFPAKHKSNTNTVNTEFTRFLYCFLISMTSHETEELSAEKVIYAFFGQRNYYALYKLANVIIYANL